jgi:hypothetical protein
MGRKNSDFVPPTLQRSVSVAAEASSNFLLPPKTFSAPLTSPAGSTKQEKVQDFKREAWTAALARVGVDFAKQGTPAYDQVMKIYREEELPKVTPPIYKYWGKACQYVTGQAWIKREDPAYAEVRNVYEWMLNRVGQMQDPEDFKTYEAGNRRAEATFAENV